MGVAERWQHHGGAQQCEGWGPINTGMAIGARLSGFAWIADNIDFQDIDEEDILSSGANLAVPAAPPMPKAPGSHDIEEAVPPPDCRHVRLK